MANIGSRSRTKHKLIVRSVTELRDGQVEIHCTQTEASDPDSGQRDLGETVEKGYKSYELYRADTPVAEWHCITSLDNRYRVGDEILIDFRPAR